MKRDGALTSLWQDAMPEYISKTIKLPKQHMDVIIVGGGITGLSTALSLQKAGKKCLLIEAHTIGFGTTGGTTAHLNTIMDTPYSHISNYFGEEGAKLIASGSREAINKIKSTVQEYNIDCRFEEVSAYIYAQNDKQHKELQDIYESAVKVGIDIGACDFIPVPIPFTKAMLVKDQAKFHPSRYIYTLAEAFEQLGGLLLQYCSVMNHEKKQDGLEVTTNIGHIQTIQLIYATHIPPGVNLLHFYTSPFRSYAMAVKLKGGIYPTGLSYDMEDPYHYYRTQEVDGEKYLIAGGEDHKTAHEENTKNCFHNLEAHIRKWFNVDSIPFKWSSQYFEPVDGLPYIGHLPGNPDNVYVATGFGGNGMIYGTLASDVLTDLVLTGESKYKALFNPSRVKPLASFTNIIKEGADVTAHLIKSLVPVEKLTELADMAPDEARIVKYNGQAIALYKDVRSNLHALNPACTHIKCTVSWNTAEHSWDCPCHGSRFSCDGIVLTAPSTKNLEQIDLVSESNTSLGDKKHR